MLLFVLPFAPLTPELPAPNRASNPGRRASHLSPFRNISPARPDRAQATPCSIHGQLYCIVNVTLNVTIHTGPFEVLYTTNTPAIQNPLLVASAPFLLTSALAWGSLTGVLIRGVSTKKWQTPM
jgi:hypothetical protein